MTSLATTIKAIDAALIAKYSGITILTGAVPTVTAVAPFIEEPLPEAYTERVFPSISIKLLSILPDYSRIYETEDFSEEETDYDDTVSPPVRNMRSKPLPYRLMYAVDTWHKARAGESRDLLTEAILHRTQPRGSLTVQNIDGVNIPVWLFWEGGIRTLDEVDVDEMIYHKTLSVIVLSYLSTASAEDVSEEKAVTETRLSFYNRHVEISSSGVTIDDSKNVKDISIRVTDTDEAGS
jgi:hypothetical protein